MNKVELKMIPTGLEELDSIILARGGLPQYSLNIICGPPGSGKTIFCYQMLFANLSEHNKAICFTTLSEPPIKVLRYLQQFSFFDRVKYNQYIQLVDLSTILRESCRKETGKIAIDFMTKEIEKHSASLVVIDSFKAISPLLGGSEMTRRFTYDLEAELTALQCTTFLIGEYTEEEIASDPQFAIADGIIVLSSDRKGYLRRSYLEILKMRGENYFAGRHRFLINSDGIIVYPRLKPKELLIPDKTEEKRRLKTGIVGLDKMTAGGVYTGSTTIVAGPSGVGKTILSLQFLTEGVNNGQKGLFVSFEESPNKIFSLAKTCGIELDRLVKEKQLILYHCSPVELCVDTFHHQLISLIEKEKPERVIIDSIADISITIADPTNLKNYLLSMVSRFSELGVTSIFTTGITEDETIVTATRLSVVIDTIILLRYKEEQDKIKRFILVFKMRGSDHDKAIREFKITSKGIEING